MVVTRREASESAAGPRAGGSRALRIIGVAIGACRNRRAWRGGAQAALHGRHHIRLGTGRVCPGAGQRVDRAGRRHRASFEREQSDAITYPASLTKMMTLYLTFEALNTGRLRLDQYLPVSIEAASKSPTKLGLRPGDSVDVQDLILGIVTRSANDAAAVLAEGLAGSEPAFADSMNRKAQQARDAEHLLSQCLRPARSRAAHHGARHRPVGARPLSRLPARIPIFFNSRVQFSRNE